MASTNAGGKASKPKPKVTIKAVVTTQGQTKVTGSLKKPGVGTAPGKGDVKVTRTKPTVKFYPETKQSMEQVKKGPGSTKPTPAKPTGKITPLPKRVGPSKSKSIINRGK